MNTPKHPFPPGSEPATDRTDGVRDKTNRPTRRGIEPLGIPAGQRHIVGNTDGDSPAIRAGASTPAEATPARLGRAKLRRLARELSPMDRQLLDFLADYRLATTGQLARLTAPSYNGPRSALRQTNRHLTRLATHGLIRRLERRIGGLRAGSSSGIWTLTTAGNKLCALTATEPTGTANARGAAGAAGQDDRAPDTPARSAAAMRVRRAEPSLAFLEHTLAVTELGTRLAELHHTGRLRVLATVPEPRCWRRSLGPAGQPLWLKPDLTLITESLDGFEDHWFCEADRATEAPSRILAKCHQYQAYRASGREQATSGLFPAVLWVVPDERRCQQLASRLAAEPDLTPGLFTITTLADFASTIVAGPNVPDQA